MGNRVEAVEQVGGGITGGVADTVPDSIVKMLGKVLGDESEDVAGGGSSHLTVAFCGACAKERRNGRVRLEVGDNGAEVSFEVAEVDAEVVVHGTFGIVGSELGVAGERAYALLVTDTGATGHVLERVAYADNGEHKEVRTVFYRSLLILFESE